MTGPAGPAGFSGSAANFAARRASLDRWASESIPYLCYFPTAAAETNSSTPGTPDSGICLVAFQLLRDPS